MLPVRLLNHFTRLYEFFPQAGNKNRLRDAQIRSVINLTPVMVMANLVILALFLWMYSNTPEYESVLIWASIHLVALFYYVVKWVLHRKRRRKRLRGESIKRPTGSTNSYLELVVLAISHGALWGTAAPFFGFVGDPSLRVALCVSLASVMMVGGAWLATLPSAVWLFVIPMAFGCASALLTQPHSDAIVPLFILLTWLSLATPMTSWFYSKLFRSHVIALESAKLQSAAVSTLLNELQEHSSDWVWETDQFGDLLRFPESMIPLGDKSEKTNLIDYLSRVVVIKGAQIDEMQFAFESQCAFDDVVLCINNNGIEKWYRFSGRPIKDSGETVVGYVGTGSDITSEKLAETRIDTLSRNDTLTGLMNRAAFAERLNQAVANMNRYGRPCTILYLDIDHFKLINDTRGHSFGDRLLAEASERMLDEVREGDCVARLGGDEFAILMDGQGGTGAATRLANRLIGSVSQVYTFEEQEFKVGLSIGIALAPINGNRAEQLLRNADLALYRAKADGRGVFRFFENSMDSEMRERRMLEAELRDAVEKDELVLHFQPLVGASTRKTVGFEGLIRWQHPIRGLLPPNEFVDIAERTNLIAEIGAWTLEKACRSAVNWPQGFFVAVNLSPYHFMKVDIANEVRQALDASGLAPKRLELEITESLLLNSTDEVIAKLNAIKALGVSVAMDDFGTGYSSLASLMNVPFDRLKIDRSFVQQVPDSDAGKKIVRMIGALASELGLTVTAEGVENERQAKFLSEIGCDLLQGFLFSKPMGEELLPAYVLKTLGNNWNIETENPASLGPSVNKRHS